MASSTQIVFPLGEACKVNEVVVVAAATAVPLPLQAATRSLCAQQRPAAFLSKSKPTAAAIAATPGESFRRHRQRAQTPQPTPTTTTTPPPPLQQQQTAPANRRDRSTFADAGGQTEEPASESASTSSQIRSAVGFWIRNGWPSAQRSLFLSPLIIISSGRLRSAEAGAGDAIFSTNARARRSRS